MYSLSCIVLYLFGKERKLNNLWILEIIRVIIHQNRNNEKLRAVHYTAVPNIEVGSGETHTLTDAEILFKDSTDYHGSLIMENGIPSQYLFDGGYCSLKDNSGNPAVSYHYYDRDHLGNIRGVIDENGTVEQITNYYPFGAPYSDATTTNPTFQRYKYNGKELELMHGLKWYDYGARWYDPLLVNWNRPDPSHKDYYPWSPYAYCMGNPIRYIDLYGLFPTGIITIHYQKVPKAMSSSITGVTITTERQTTYYNFTKSAAHLLSLVSGVSEGYIRNVRLEEFKGQPKNNSITLGSNPENTRMLVSPTYFDESDMSDGQYYDWWFREFSHEVGHIKQIERDQNLGMYLLKSIYGYVRTMSHDKAPREEEAEKGSTIYKKFRKFVQDVFETDLTTLFTSKESEEYKINQIDNWWNSYKKQGR